MELEISLFCLLLATGFFAGLIDAMAGGGGMIALPVLLATGMSPVEALATNKLQGCFGTFTSARYFIKKKFVNLAQMRAAIICTFFGAATGTLLIQQLDSGFLQTILPLLLIAIAMFFLFSPTLSDTDKQQRLGGTLFGFIIGGGVGFYDGFFGPGTGTFFTLAYITLAGYGLAKATAHTKVLNFTSNIAALVFFAVGGHIVWLAGLTMAVGQIAGGYIGAKLVISQGKRLIKPLLVTMTLLLSVKLLLES